MIANRRLSSYGKDTDLCWVAANGLIDWSIIDKESVILWSFVFGLSVYSSKVKPKSSSKIFTASWYHFWLSLFISVSVHHRQSCFGTMNPKSCKTSFCVCTTCSLFQLCPIAIMPASISFTIFSSPNVLWRFSIRVNLSISFWYVAFAWPRLTDVKKTTTSDSNNALDTFRSSSSGWLILARHLWHLEGFFSLSESTDSLSPHEFQDSHETLPSHGWICNVLISICVMLFVQIWVAMWFASWVDLAISLDPLRLFEVVRKSILFLPLRWSMVSVSCLFISKWRKMGKCFARNVEEYYIFATIDFLFC